MGAETGGLTSGLFLAGSGVNAAAGAANAYTQHRALRQQAGYIRQTAEEDALMRELQVKDVERAGDRAAALRGRETAALIASQQVQGGPLDDGSILNITGDTAEFGALDAEMERNNAWREAWGLRANATNIRRAGRNARDAANFNARMTAATGGLQFGRDVLDGTYKAEMFRPAPKTVPSQAPGQTSFRANTRRKT